MVKKLIEVALPLEKINAESAREKSIRHGHPSTLHLWWARRPLAAARAVIWASLVDDPSSHPELFPTESDQNKERQRLFGILEDLVIWEKSNDPECLKVAQEEIKKYTNGNLPELLDPFSGGGAIPLEAQRLGLNVHAHDLNPVSVMINKAMVEIPPRFSCKMPVNPNDMVSIARETWIRATGLASDIRYYGSSLKQKAYEKVGNLYPTITDERGNEYTVIAWIWARTVKSPNPLAKGAKVPLVSSLLLSKKKGAQAWVEIVEDTSAPDGWYFEVRTGTLSKQEELIKTTGTKAGKAKDFVCCLTKTPIQREYIQAEGKAGRLSKRLMAIIAQGKNGRVFFSPNEEHEKLAMTVDQDTSVAEARDSFLNGSTPTRAMVTGGVCSAYGLDTWGKLFTGRQITMLTTLSSLFGEIKTEIENDAIIAGLKNDHIPLYLGGSGARAYAEAICVYLSFIVNKLADRGSVACSWDSSRDGLRNTFGRQAIPMVWDYAEGNPFCNASGCFDNMLDWVVKCVNEFPAVKTGEVSQADAQEDCGLRELMVSTDPPYYDNISYADLSDFFYVWMRQCLKDIYPPVFKTMLVPKGEELVATAYRHGGSLDKAKEFFENGMSLACRRIYEYVREDIPVSIYYAYKQSETDRNDQRSSSGWETMLTSIINAGFIISGTWPIRTEMANRAVAFGTNALASSIVLVCRKRSDDAPQTTRRNLINNLRRELRPALQKLQESNIAPVDLAQSAIGPGMGVFSRYRKVLEADGSAMTVRSALQVINDEIDLYFNEQVGDLDGMSRFCVDLYTQSAFNDIKFGDADILARAKGTSVAALASHGVVYAKAGNVHLVERTEILEKIDNNESCIWLLTQQLTQAMATGGVEACAKAIFMMFGSNAEKAKDLAYRLYTIAEQKKWANEAFAYNALVVAWPDIQSRAAMMQRETPEQMDMFSMGLLNT